MNSVLRCEGLVRRFGERTAVDGVGFEIAAGETYGLLGPNGAGKTTTISMIAGILEPDAGVVEIEGRRVQTRDPEAKRTLGFVPQEIALFDDLSAAENLRFFGGLQGLGGRELHARVAATLDLVGLADRAGDRVGEFSGGMQRRANIAVGLLHQPRLLVLDEPTAGVDPQSRNQILESIERLGDQGLAVLYTTHYMEEAERLCDRVGIIDGGRIVAEGTRRALVAQIGEHDRIVVRTEAASGVVATSYAEAVRHLAGVIDVRATEDDSLEVLTDDAAATLAAVVAAAPGAGVAVTGVEVREPNLEAVFLHLTGKALRDRSE
ncbi:MAG: ABC transporter ATP-binding protein [Acidimicrobiales bacterium]